MGDWYGFDFIKVDDEWEAGVVFMNKDSDYNEKQMQLTEYQKLLVNAWLKKQEDLMQEQEKMIKDFISSPDSLSITEMKFD